ncbi:hypothetical protein [Bradyrhizobium sp. LA2.1]|uniref:hypothetical protein n=1 Tax=Bradyrhizobium sp. LA2.1 TaxID=3156376 RepID=UPI0033986D6D
MTENMLDRLRDVVLFVAGIIAVGSLIMAAFEGFNQRVASASFLGTLGVVCTFMVFMPKLEVFKVWGIEARLNKTLDRAEEILGKLQHLSVISAKSTYMSYAWANRIGSPSAKAKQAILDDVDKQLTELRVTEAERKEIVAPYVALIGWDFYQMYVRIIDRYMGARYSDLANQMSKGDPSSGSRAKLERWAVLVGEWRARTIRDDLFAKAQQLKIDDLLAVAEPGEFMSKEESTALHRLRDDISRLFKDCEKKGGYTAEAAEYYDRYFDMAGWDKKIIELFNYNPSAPR